MDDAPCTEQSASLSEPLAGTAPAVTDTWLLVEHPDVWPAKALAAKGIPATVRRRLTEFSREVPGVRVVLIRRGASTAGSGRRVFFVRAPASEPRVWNRRVDHLEELLDAPLEDWARGHCELEGEPSTEPIFLACTHGKRDRCCATFGVPVYRSLAALAPDAAWQVSHVGGHRFAANVVVLPHGVYYGRVPPGAAALMVAMHRAGSLSHFDLYRGRACHPVPAQVADRALRLELHERAIAAIEVAAVEGDGATWRVDLRHVPEGRLYRVEVARDPDLRLAKGCGEEVSVISHLSARSVTPIG